MRSAVLRTGAAAGSRRGEQRDRPDPFLGIASIGFDSDVQERVLASRVRLGALVYLYCSLRTITGWKPAEFRCTVDGAPLHVRGWAVAVSNSGMYGGGMRLAPAASMEDGALDVVSTAETGRLRFARMLPRVFQERTCTRRR